MSQATSVEWKVNNCEASYSGFIGTEKRLAGAGSYMIVTAGSDMERIPRERARKYS
jgi:hypothetical protein